MNQSDFYILMELVLIIKMENVIVYLQIINLQGLAKQESGGGPEYHHSIRGWTSSRKNI